MTQPIQTHINAYYSDLITAKQEAAAANQRVIELEEAIRARGGEVPGDTVPEAEAPAKEDTASSDDVSAVEKPSKDNKSKKDER